MAALYNYLFLPSGRAQSSSRATCPGARCSQSCRKDFHRMTDFRLRQCGRIHYSQASLGDFSNLLTSESDSGDDLEDIRSLQSTPDHVFSQFGPELVELCKLQLALASAGVGRGTVTSPGLAITVYGRCPHSFESGALELVQLASSGPASAGSSGRAAMEGLESDLGVIVLGATSPSSTEASLVSQEWILLPSSNSVVMPLAYGPLLVGLVLVELVVPPLLSDRQNAPRARIPEGGHLHSSFAPEDKDVLLNMARSITIACVMDQRVTLLQAQAATGREHMSGLVDDAKGPLAALNTIGSMLTPRLKQGEPEQDMAQAMMVQGQRLKEVVQQLQSALRPGPHVTQETEPALVASSSAPPTLPYSPLALKLSRSGRASGRGDAPQTTGRGAIESEDQRLLAPVPSTSFSSIREHTQDSPGGGAAWCNSITVVMDLVNSSSAVCMATGVRIELGKGLQRYQQRVDRLGGDDEPPTIMRPLLPLNVAISASALRVAFSQVLDSSLQRTPHGGKITLDAERCDDGNAYLWVSDSGEGLESSITNSLNSGCLPSDVLKTAQDQSAMTAMTRIKSHKPAGLGLIGIKIASDMLGKEGGSVTVHAGISGTVVCIALPLWLE